MKVVEIVHQTSQGEDVAQGGVDAVVVEVVPNAEISIVKLDHICLRGLLFGGFVDILGLGDEVSCEEGRPALRHLLEVDGLEAVPAEEWKEFVSRSRRRGAVRYSVAGCGCSGFTRQGGQE